MIDRDKIERQLDPGMGNGLELDVAVVGAGSRGPLYGLPARHGSAHLRWRRELATYCQRF